MNTKIVLLTLTTIILFSCNKSEFSNNPQLTFESVNKTSLNDGDELIFQLGFTDKQGVVDTLFIKRISKVCSNTSNTGWGLDSTSYPTLIPSYPATKNQKGSISVLFGYNDIADSSLVNLNACLLMPSADAAKTDTSYFEFCLKDASGNLSDTVKSPPITFNK